MASNSRMVTGERIGSIIEGGSEQNRGHICRHSSRLHHITTSNTAVKLRDFKPQEQTQFSNDQSEIQCPIYLSLSLSLSA
jgi:hypothetical protein